MHRGHPWGDWLPEGGGLATPCPLLLPRPLSLRAEPQSPRSTAALPSTPGSLSSSVFFSLEHICNLQRGCGRLVAEHADIPWPPAADTQGGWVAKSVPPATGRASARKEETECDLCPCRGRLCGHPGLRPYVRLSLP